MGGGPAGLAAAIAARLKGFDVTVADAARPPIDKACGEGLMPDSFVALRRLGVRLDADESLTFRGVRFVGEGVSVTANFPGESGTAVRRTRLHQALIDRASEVGVRMFWETRVPDLSAPGIECRWLIGADGQNSRVRRWADLDKFRHDSYRFGFRRHYRLAPWSDYVETYWSSGSQMYVTPINHSEVGVALLTRDPHLRVETALPQFPDLSRKLAGAPVSSSERGAVTASRRLRRVVRGRTILVGDASGSVDAITGEGLALGFHQAIALADALASGNLDAYEAAHKKLEWRPHMMARLLLLLDRSPRLRQRVLRAFASKPDIFANLLAMHVGSIAPSDFLLHGMLPLGVQILTAS